MLKRIMIALAGLFVILGLAVVPASGVQSTLDMHPEFNLGGTPAQVEVVPSACTSTPLEVRSALNQTATDALFFSNEDCDGPPLATAVAGGDPVNIFDEVHEIGATHYKAP